MPQGKGTYGSQVGNPSFKKGKKKYQTGGNVDPFSNRNPEGVVVDKTMEALDMQNEMQEGIPTANAMDRKQVMPDTEQYNDGGKVSKPEYVPGGAQLHGPKSKSVRRKKKRIGKIADKIVSGSNRKDITDVVKQVNKQSKKYHKIDWEDEWDV